MGKVMISRPLVFTVLFSLSFCKSYLAQADQEENSEKPSEAVVSLDHSREANNPPNLYTIGGIISGLNGVIILQKNGEELLSRGSNGPFQFSGQLADGENYVVSIAQNPQNQICVVENGEGQIQGSHVSDILVRCDSDLDWFQDAYLKTPDVEQDDKYANVVASWQDTVVVSALSDGSLSRTIVNNNGHVSPTNDGAAVGAVYIFQRDKTGSHCTIPPGEDSCWYQDAYLKPSNAEGDQIFGSSLAIFGDTVVVGAAGEASNETQITNNNGQADFDTSASGSGAVYIYQRDRSGQHCTIPAGESWCWYQDAYLKPSNGRANIYFGWAVGISGSTVVVGAPGEDSRETSIWNNNGQADSDTSASESGAVYIYQRDRSGQHCTIPAGESWCWYQDAYLKPSNGRENIYFGSAVGISGSTVAVGAYGEPMDSVLDNDNGEAATSPDSAPGSGAVYIYQRDRSGQHCTIPAGESWCWYQDAYLKPSNVQQNSRFGQSVAVSGSLIAVGAPGEKADFRGIDMDDGDASNDTHAENSGAVYIFKKDNLGNWRQDAYLKASNAERYDQMGLSLALSGSFLFAGAPGEASDDNDIVNQNGKPDPDHGSIPTGAIYVFRVR
ncbi:MAG: FG-GAP repeat protein [Leptospiraceae bacterium]|nr:FG-GAP repeat protein [Leptospiraceae bacterium]